MLDMRHLTVAAVAVAAALLTAGCTTAASSRGATVAASRLSAPAGTTGTATPGGATPGASAAPGSSATTRGPLSVHLVLPSRVYVAGTTATATIVIDNAGPPVRFIDCIDAYQVVLVNRHVHPQVGWMQCAERDVIPRGESVRKVAVMATYTSCGTAAGAGLVGCLPGGKIPPLPAGTYQAQLVPVNTGLLPAPPPVTVQVVAPAG
jgi:hypothetical protein